MLLLPLPVPVLTTLAVTVTGVPGETLVAESEALLTETEGRETGACWVIVDVELWPYTLAAAATGIAGPPGSTIAPFAVPSASPRPPSVIASTRV